MVGRWVKPIFWIRTAIAAVSLCVLLDGGSAQAADAVAERQRELDQLLRQQKLNQIEREHRTNQSLHDSKSEQLRQQLDRFDRSANPAERQHQLYQMEQRLNQLELERGSDRLRLEHEIGRLEQQRLRDKLGDGQRTGIQQRQDHSLQDQKSEQLRGKLNQLRQQLSQ